MAPIDTAEVFRLRNDSETEALDLSLNGRTFKVAPGKSALVPFELIRIYWGDPRSRPEVYTKFSDGKERGYVNKREDEISRLGNLYGSFATDVASLLDPAFPPNSDRYGETKHVPHPVSVRTEAGETITLPCFDQKGDKVYAAVQTDTVDLNDQVVYRQHLEEKMDALRAELEDIRNGGVGNGADDTTVDGQPLTAQQ